MKFWAVRIVQPNSCSIHGISTVTREKMREMEPNLENDLNLRDDEQRAASLRALEELEGLTGMIACSCGR
jgi:hypothetical protein